MSKTPIDTALVAGEKLAAIQARHDYKLWNAWKEDPTPETMRPLMAHFEPVFQSKLRTWKAPNTNAAAFHAELKIQAIKAIQDYDPNHGAALRTHLENRLKKAMRYNTQQQNAMRLSEDSAGFIGRIDTVSTDLQEDLGREPTFGEIATTLNERFNPRRPLTAKRVESIQQSRVRDVLTSNLEFDPTSNTVNRDREIVTLLRPTLPQEHQTIFDHLYGLNGKKRINSTGELARELGKTPSQISRIRTAILKKFDEHR